MKRITVLVGLVALALVGCASAPRRDAPPPVREVRVPVMVPCVTAPVVKPPFAVDALPLGSDVWAQMKALRAERLQRKGYEFELETALDACRNAAPGRSEKPPN